MKKTILIIRRTKTKQLWYFSKKNSLRNCSFECSVETLAIAGEVAVHFLLFASTLERFLDEFLVLKPPFHQWQLIVWLFTQKNRFDDVSHGECCEKKAAAFSLISSSTLNRRCQYLNSITFSILLLSFSVVTEK